MKKPILVVMAAGMGSRYGGLKQIDPVGPNGEIIIDYSLYDAKQAGFETVVFIIKKEIEKDFKESVGNRVSQYMDVRYAFQNIDDLPEGFSVPEGRKKPWGTAHAVMSARDIIDGPFVAINADDFYGRDAFKVIYNYLSAEHPENPYPFCMVAYNLANTLTENGYVSRGVCETDENGYLTKVTEHLKIEKAGEDAQSIMEDKTVMLCGCTPVSMNMWGFTKDFVTEAWEGFPEFLENGISTNPEKCEYYLPSVVTRLIESGKAAVKVLTSSDKWYGVTYKEDKPMVQQAMADMHASGRYPEKLWE